METITISKKEYKRLLSQAKAYQKLAKSFFENTALNPIEDVVNDFRKTGLYKDEFLEDLDSGLRKSTYFKFRKMKIKPLRKDLEEYLQKHNLKKKFEKSKKLFEQNTRHPSLNTELLEPAWRGIYSFRLDKKYRAIFFIASDTAEIITFTNHYKK